MKKLLLILVIIASTIQSYTMDWRGIVYDVGLGYGDGVYSVDTLNLDVVEYDMNIISNILRANAIRIEGEDITCLAAATRLAHKANLKVFFNPWMMNATADDVVAYMSEAAKTAEKLRNEGIDITFVTGCEFTLFNKGIFEGNSVTERLQSMMKIGQYSDDPEKIKAAMDDVGAKLNNVLSDITRAVRNHFKGDVIYSAGTWEPVDWSLFDAIGIDYYRDTQTDDEYLSGLDKYFQYDKPVWVMEVGCCTFEGAAALGGGGFTVCQGVDADGNGIYTTGTPPVRSEKEQADYAEAQIRILDKSGIEGMFIFEFSFPIAPYRENGQDADLTAYPIVKSFDKNDPRSLKMPPWEPKEAFYRVGLVYHELE